MSASNSGGAYMKICLFSISFLLCIAILWQTAAGQCTSNWLPGAGIAGVDGIVYASTVWDPDGPGPQPPMLIVAGQFVHAGNVTANNIAAWNGSRFVQLDRKSVV